MMHQFIPRPSLVLAFFMLLEHSSIQVKVKLYCTILLLLLVAILGPKWHWVIDIGLEWAWQPLVKKLSIITEEWLKQLLKR